MSSVQDVGSMVHVLNERSHAAALASMLIFHTATVKSAILTWMVVVMAGLMSISRTLCNGGSCVSVLESVHHFADIAAVRCTNTQTEDEQMVPVCYWL
jgi:hypothetical protein